VSVDFFSHVRASLEAGIAFGGGGTGNLGRTGYTFGSPMLWVGLQLGAIWR
jgi:hypothetical protein